MRPLVKHLACIAIAGAAVIGAPRARASDYRIEYVFNGPGDGQAPTFAPVEHGGKLYGVTGFGGAYSGGTLYSFNPNTGTETVLYNFGSGVDGFTPNGGLIGAEGRLYGVTKEGGRFGHGAVFSFNPASGKEQVVYSFGGDGESPAGRLLAAGGLLFGAAQYGGETNCPLGCGNVFSLDPKTGAHTIIHAFSGGSDGASPNGGFVEMAGLLYGTTLYGGGSSACQEGCGTLFSLDPTTGAETVLKAFNAANNTSGAAPMGGLVALGGLLYGTTFSGGVEPYCCGTVFSFDPSSGTEALVYAFLPRSKEGLSPGRDLIAVQGTLYGVTFDGGSDRHGTVFSLTPGGAETVLHSFTNRGADGVTPISGLVHAEGRLFGTTAVGYAAAGCPKGGCGVLYSLLP